MKKNLNEAINLLTICLNGFRDLERQEEEEPSRLKALEMKLEELNVTVTKLKEAIIG